MSALSKGFKGNFLWNYMYESCQTAEIVGRMHFVACTRSPEASRRQRKSASDTSASLCGIMHISSLYELRSEYVMGVMRWRLKYLYSTARNSAETTRNKPTFLTVENKSCTLIYERSAALNSQAERMYNQFEQNKQYFTGSDQLTATFHWRRQ